MDKYVKAVIGMDAFHWKCLKFVFIIYILELLLSAIIIFFLGLNLIKTPLDQKIQRIHEDIHFTNGNWDMNEYINDPALLGKSTLYLITTDGLVLDRRSPIHGFLDTSDFKRLLTYKYPQNLTTVPHQTRRIYSQPIMSGNKPVGVIAVSYFNPQPEILPTVDAQLASSMKYIAGRVKVKNGTIAPFTIDERVIPFRVAYTVVDQYNTVLSKVTNVSSTARIPNFIDSSYVKKQLNAPRETFIRDNQTGEIFFVKTEWLHDSKGIPTGFVTLGTSMQSVITLLGQYIFLEGILGLVLLLICLFFFAPLMRNTIHPPQSEVPSSITFSEVTGVLSINKHIIEIPYDTNQFYLLQALFQKPTKRWETDELLKKFGENEMSGNGRKVYDTMVKINKKVVSVAPIKLILNQHKTYQLNPKLLSHFETH